MQQKDMNNVKWRCPKCGSVSDISQVHCGRCGTDLLVMGKLVYVDVSGNVIGEVTAEDSARMDIPFVDIENDPDPSVTPGGKKETRRPEKEPIHQEEQNAPRGKNPSHGENAGQSDMQKEKKEENPAYTNGAVEPHRKKSSKRKIFWITGGCILAFIIAGAGIMAWNLISLQSGSGNTVGRPRNEATPAPTQKANGRDNLLKADIVDVNAENNKVFGSNISREAVDQVVIFDTQKDAPEDAWDVSVAGDRCVVAWVEKEGAYYTLYLAGEGGVNASQACETLFDQYTNLKSIAFNDAFYTEGCTSMYCMFADCSKLEILDLKDFDTSEVTTFQSMFYDCAELHSLEIDSFDTSSATNMYGMFNGCSSLRDINVSKFDTSNVTSMQQMFYGCSGLSSIDVTGFDTAKVTTMKSMFNGCENLQELDISGFHTSNVTDMSYMFNNCRNLTYIDMSKFDITNVKTVEYMFNGCENLQDLGFGNLQTK